jgi:sortase A
MPRPWNRAHRKEAPISLKKSSPHKERKRKRGKRFSFSQKPAVTWFVQHIGIFFLIFGALFLIVPYIVPMTESVEQQTQEPIRPDTSFTVNSSAYEIPERIVIPSVSIDLDVTPSKLIDGYWETSLSSASFGEGSAAPGIGSNTVVFAHAREGLFLPLKNIKEGDTVYLLTHSQHFSYTVDTIAEVNPTDVYTIRPTEDERLTLFTCSGFLDSKRLVVVAKPTQ